MAELELLKQISGQLEGIQVGTVIALILIVLIFAKMVMTD
jgi:hypothetical protein